MVIWWLSANQRSNFENQPGFIFVTDSTTAIIWTVGVFFFVPVHCFKFKLTIMIWSFTSGIFVWSSQNRSLNRQASTDLSATQVEQFGLSDFNDTDRANVGESVIRILATKWGYLRYWYANFQSVLTKKLLKFSITLKSDLKSRRYSFFQRWFSFANCS